MPAKVEFRAEEFYQKVKKSPGVNEKSCESELCADIASTYKRGGFVGVVGLAGAVLAKGCDVLREPWA